LAFLVVFSEKIVFWHFLKNFALKLLDYFNFVWRFLMLFGVLCFEQ